MGWFILIAVIMWILQAVFGLWQFKKFNAHFKLMRGQGRVAIGRAKGKFRAGVVVLLCIDADCRIIKGEKLQGLTIFAGFKPLDHFNGRLLTDLTADDCASLDKNTKTAVLNAIDNYRAFEQQKLEQSEASIKDTAAENL